MKRASPTLASVKPGPFPTYVLAVQMMHCSNQGLNTPISARDKVKMTDTQNWVKKKIFLNSLLVEASKKIRKVIRKITTITCIRVKNPSTRKELAIKR